MLHSEKCNVIINHIMNLYNFCIPRYFMEISMKYINNRGWVKMEENNMDFELATKEVLIKWLAKLAFLGKEQKRLLFEIGCIYRNNMEFLYQIYAAIATNQECLMDKERNITYKFQGDNHVLMYNGENLLFTEAQLKTVLVGIIDIMEEILPLGSVVDLKKEFLKGILANTDKVEQVRVVITNRFLHQKDDRSYFTYAGVLYPIGTLMQQEQLHFTSALIENVVHKGYSDKQEEAYVFLMKNELILENAMHSFGFSTEEEREKYCARQQIQE